jgi:hypothetical protein
MSAHTLLNLPTTATIQTGIVTTDADQVTNVTFGTSFPSGSYPLIFLQNTEGPVWPTIFFTIQSISNTGFQIVQTYTAPATNYQTVTVAWSAILVPATPVP